MVYNQTANFHFCTNDISTTLIMARKQIIEYRLLQKVSKLYYDHDFTQQKISERLNISRPKVSRLLKQARELGIVKISISGIPGIHSDLENAIEKKYGIREVCVVEVSDPQSQAVVSGELGVAAADYFSRAVTDPSLIGVSWGTTLRAMADAIPDMEYKNSELVQVLGGLGLSESEAHASYILRRMVAQIGSKLRLLNLPGILDSAAMKDAFLSESHAVQVFKLYKHLDIAFIGLGAPTPDSVMMRDGTILTDDELEMLLEKGAVVDICLRFIYEQGNFVQSEINDRVISSSLDELKALDNVVGGAGGPDKVHIIRAALLGGYITHLITDQLTGAQLLED